MRTPTDARAQVAGLLAGGLLAAVLAVGLLAVRDGASTATPALVLILPGVVAAIVGGRTTAAAVALATSVAFGVLFLPPYGRWKILDPEDVVAAVVFVVVAVGVGELTAREADRRRTAEFRADELERLGATLAAADAERERMETELDRMAVIAEVDQQRAALLRTVSHDLRTPLATIRAVATDLRGDTPYDDETRAELLGLVSDEAERLDRLVTNLLSMSRVEAGAFAPEKQAVDLPELLATSGQRMGRALATRRLELELAGDLPLVDADYTQVDQVVANLLENAARHSPQRSTVRIGARRVGEMVEVWVENSGTGVIATERARIFEAFHRSHGSRSSGIGLAICKAVVEAHGGTIGVRDAVGGGARFTFTLPVFVDRTHPPTAPKVPSPTPQAEPMSATDHPISTEDRP